MTEQEIEQRAEKAVQLFKEGYNCSQAVFASCADIYGIEDEALALRLSASFGGGIGRMRMVCGAASGMFLLAGLHNGSATPHDSEGKMANYAFVQELAGAFKNTYGSLICAELLGMATKKEVRSDEVRSTKDELRIDPKPEERTPQYYEKRPCVEMVAQAVRIYLRTL